MQAVLASTWQCQTALQHATACSVACCKRLNVVSAVAAGGCRSRCTSVPAMALMTSAGTCLPPGSVAAQHCTQHVLPVAVSTPSTASAFMQAVRHALPRHSMATSVAIQANAYTARQERIRLKNMLATVNSPDGSSSSSNGHSNGHSNSNGMPEDLSLAHSNGNTHVQGVAENSMNNGGNARAAQAPAPHTSMEGAHSTASLNGHSQEGSSNNGTGQYEAAGSSKNGTGHGTVAGSSASGPVRQNRTRRRPHVGRQYQTTSAGSSLPFQFNPMDNSLGVSSSLHPGAQVQLRQYEHGAVAVASETTSSAALAQGKLDFDSIPASDTPPACQSSLDDSQAANGSLFLDPLPPLTGDLAASNVESECISAASVEPVVPETPESIDPAAEGSGASMEPPVPGSTELEVLSGEVALAMSQAPSKSAAARSKARKGRQSKVKDKIASETEAEPSAAVVSKGRARRKKSETEAAGSDVTVAQNGEAPTPTSPRSRGRKSKGAASVVGALSGGPADIGPSGIRGVSTSTAPAAAAAPPMSAAAKELDQKAKEAEDEAGRLIKDVFIVTKDNKDDAAKLYKAMQYLAMCPVPHDDRVYSPNDKDTTRYFACDTEVAYIDVTKESPVGHGVVTCISIYCGPDVDLRKLHDPDIYRQIQDAVDAATRWGIKPAVGSDGRHLLTPDVSPVLADSDARAAEALSEDVPQSRMWVDVWDEISRVPALDDQGNEMLDEKGKTVMKVDWQDGKVKGDGYILASMKEFMEDEDIPKVWHNYGFDRHVLANLDIECKGFKGDTMHMARLHDASRRGTKNYSLENLSRDTQVMTRYLMPKKGAKKAPLSDAKTGMKEVFGKAHIKKDGEVGKLVTLPPIHELHTNRQYHNRWIHYSALDAKATWQLREALYLHLNGSDREWKIDPYLRDKIFPQQAAQQQAAQQQAALPTATLTTGVRPRRRKKNVIQPVAGAKFPEFTMWDLYRELWIPFGLILTDMEKRGMCVDREHLRQAQKQAEADMTAAREKFRSWISKLGKQFEQQYEQESGMFQPLRWEAINPSSGPQIRQLLYPEHGGDIHKGPPKKVVDPATAPSRSRSPSPQRAASLSAGLIQGGSFPADTPGGVEQEPVDGPPPPVPDDKKKKKKATPSKAKPAPVAPAILEICPPGCRGFTVSKEDLSPENQKLIVPENKKWVQMYLHGIWGRGRVGRLVPEAFTPTGAAVVNMRVLRSLSGKVGAAKAALQKLRAEEEAAQKLRDDEEAAKQLLESAQNQAASVLIDEDDEILQQMHAEGSVAVDDPEGSVGETTAVTGEEEVVLEDSPRGKTAQEVKAQQYASDEHMKLKMEELEQKAKENGWGKMYAAIAIDFGHIAGLEACEAIEALCEASAIEKLLTAFIVPLQSDKISTKDKDGNYRVHCSLNINTETGRLSARRPNLQNQPALEKDLYKVRKAFTAPKRKENYQEVEQTLVVADYGQLELRLLAHMADCKSMLEAFVLGGDFHSRTAVGMYDYIKDDVRAGRCYVDQPSELPGGGQVAEGEEPPKAVKDKYASERRKAKILNFSIAYGKTAHGLARDFKTSLEEAQETVDKWYNDRVEVRCWQEKVKSEARAMWDQGYVPCVYTLLGRTRPLQDLVNENWSKRGHAERAAINTPIQGAAADVASSAMIAISKCPRLKELGYKLIMQVHDEVILEGPKEYAQEARQLVQEHMANPWRSILKDLRRAKGQSEDWPQEEMPLRVELATDCDNAGSWYEAK